jgi:hypothetical protein
LEEQIKCMKAGIVLGGWTNGEKNKVNKTKAPPSTAPEK